MSFKETLSDEATRKFQIRMGLVIDNTHFSQGFQAGYEAAIAIVAQDFEELADENYELPKGQGSLFYTNLGKLLY
jgi:hypothetical protein